MKTTFSKNPDAIRMRRWRMKNPERAREISRRYYRNNKEKCLSRCKKWAQSHTGQRKKTREKWNEKYLSLITEKLGNTCFLCGIIAERRVDYHEIHGKPHKYSLKFIAEHTEDFVPLCKRHHEAIHRLLSIPMEKTLMLLSKANDEWLGVVFE